MKIAYIGNQGGQSVLKFYAGMALVLRQKYGVDSVFAVWMDSECQFLNHQAEGVSCTSFENYVRITPSIDFNDIAYLTLEYREVCWSEVIAVERAFSDYSMLIGGAGDRRETNDYVQRLVVSIVRYLESAVVNCDAVVCQTADTLFSLVAAKVARHHGIRYFAIRPGTLLEPGKGGGFFANTEYLECERMGSAYADRSDRVLTRDEHQRTEALIEAIRGFGGLTAFHAATSKGKFRGRRAITPNLKRLLPYLVENSRRNKNVEYIKFDVTRKLCANILRVTRKLMIRNCFGSTCVNLIPNRSVFYALHYQPEQSTLAQGVWYANQVALVENISKSLPLGYTLVVKEHPWGRGNRPRWQYQHMAGFYNVQFCDADAKQIVQHVDAVIAVTGSVAMEALVFDKPCVLLGRTYFDFSDLFYRVRNIQDLPEVLARILIDGEYQNQTDRDVRLRQFLVAYLNGLIPYFPSLEYADQWGHALAAELGLEPLISGRGV